MLARYPGTCGVCHGEIVPRESDVDIHPTLRGKRGGKVYCHSQCLAKSNPARGGRRKPKTNPFVSVRRNSGCGCGGYGCWDANCDCD